ncbi:MAG TPA: glycosyltransferase family 2 protein [Candidatus Polarisedimenticolaceae bacterium]|nr:glycosyltransferase family 2 protein [Candidatus Polarisedimenticolaceae bacterium]
MRVTAVIPALDEEEAIAGVVRAVRSALVSEVIVVDNGSTDCTAERARRAGARVVSQPLRGYGRACRAGVDAASSLAEVLVFLDGDGSDCPEVMDRLLAPLEAGTHDFVIGSRIRGQREPGSMNRAQLLAGVLAGVSLRLLYGVRYTDMCPFRAIRREALLGLEMREETYGWNLEMQMKAARAGLRILEIPVPHRKRAGGSSKVSGDLVATVKASGRIFWTLARGALAKPRGADASPLR